MDRLDVLRSIAEERGADAVVVTSLPDVRWACGFSGSNGLLVAEDGRTHFVTDGRYRTQARSEVGNAQIHVAEAGLPKYLHENHLLGSASKVLFQDDDVTVAQLAELRKAAPEAEWIGASRLLVEHVARKESAEVDIIRRAQAITEEVFSDVVKWIRHGATELEIAAEVVYGHLKRGAEKMAFEPIVASGPNGGLPHARPSKRRITEGDLVVLDFGCVVDGYASDMTRTVAIGEPADDDALAAYEAVLFAKRAAIVAARPGMDVRELDAVARDIIIEAGYGAYFSHGLGHGVGLRTHEWPRVSHSSDDVLPEGAVVTIEPGVYVPDRFGIRIEDMIVVHADGAEVITATPDDLMRL